MKNKPPQSDPPEVSEQQQVAALELLHAVSSQLIRENNVQALYESLVEGASVLMRSDFASMQRLHPARGAAGELELLAVRGFDPETTRFWKWVRADSGCACGEALRRGKTVLVADVEDCDFIAGTPDQAAFRAAGIAAVLSMPLYSRAGRLIGMISTHWRQPHEPQASSVRLLEILARQAADLIEHREAEQSIREQQAALQLADRRKDEFLATLSHELRNPLAPISNAVQLISTSGDDPKIREFACRILERQVGHTVRLVSDLLEHSRITLGQIALERAPVELSAVVEAALETSRPNIERASLVLDLPAPAQGLVVDGDCMRLAQVLANILNNAAKYTPPGGRISIRTAREGDEHASIAVRDDGAGIPPDMLGRVFDTFARVDADLKRVQRGLGIGLSLSRRLVEMHGGTIEARSEGVGKGSEFIVRLPLRAADAPRKPLALVA